MDPERLKMAFFKIGFELFIMVVIGLGIGVVLDSFFLIKPWGVIAGFLCGVMAGFRALYKIL